MALFNSDAFWEYIFKNAEAVSLSEQAKGNDASVTGGDGTQHKATDSDRSARIAILGIWKQENRTSKNETERKDGHLENQKYRHPLFSKIFHLSFIFDFQKIRFFKKSSH